MSVAETTTISATGERAPVTGHGCDPETAITRSLLGYGILAMPMYVTVSVIEGLTRTGFDFTRHDWSLLANGRYGWIHVASLILAGLMTIAFGAGIIRATASRWGGGLMAAYGGGLIGAGVMRADPAMGFPAGTPDGPGTVSWHGAGHLISAGLGFACLIGACLVLARHYRRRGWSGWALFTGTTGVAFGAGFAGIAGAGGAPWSVLMFTAAVLVVTVWSAATAVREYRAR